MGKIMILTDSGCDIPENMMMDNIRIIPLSMQFDDKKILRDDKANAEELSHIINAEQRPIEVGLTKRAILETLCGIGEEYDKFIIITSSGMIYPNNEVVIEATMLEYFSKHIMSQISIIDSHTTSMALGLLILDAANMAKNGESFESIQQYIISNKQKYQIEIFANDITRLKEQKIISSRKARLVEKNKRNYLFSMTNSGCLKPTFAGKTAKSAKCKMIDRLIEGYYEYVAIVSAMLDNEAHAYGDYLSQFVENDYIRSEFSCSNTILVGHNSFGLCYKIK